MALYNVLYTNRAEMSIINEVPFTELDKAIAFADSQVEGMENVPATLKLIRIRLAATP